jgi:hypothetical protein
VVRDLLPCAIYGYVARGSETATSLLGNVAYGRHTEVQDIAPMIDSGFWRGTDDLKVLALGVLFRCTPGHAPDWLGSPQLPIVPAASPVAGTEARTGRYSDEVDRW